MDVAGKRLQIKTCGRFTYMFNRAAQKISTISSLFSGFFPPHKTRPLRTHSQASFKTTGRLRKQLTDNSTMKKTTDNTSLDTATTTTEAFKYLTALGD